MCVSFCGVIAVSHRQWSRLPGLPARRVPGQGAWQERAGGSVLSGHSLWFGERLTLPFGRAPCRELSEALHGDFTAENQLQGANRVTMSWEDLPSQIEPLALPVVYPQVLYCL